MQGYWQGTVSVGTVQTRLGFKISEPSKGKFRAELDSIDQGATGIPVTTVTYQPPNVHMDVVGVAGVFDGTLHGNEIDGTWKQGPNTMPVTLRKGSAPPTELADYRYVSDATPQGVWNGAIDAQTATLHLVLKVGKLPDGNWAAKLDSPDQGANDIPASSVQFTQPSHVSIQWKAINGAFAGELKGNKLTGSWAQAGRSFPLTFQRDKNAK
jgi:hypothetical protein